MIKNIPAHVGIILDGNGRWAKKRRLPRLSGHERGIQAIKKTIIAAKDMGIKVISFFAFSTENWKRSKEEVDGIFKIVENFLDDNKNEFNEKDLKLMVMGDISPLSENLRRSIEKGIESTKNNKGMIVNIAINYGGRDEILRAINLILKEKRDKISSEEFENYLYTKDLPPLDFVIRTSGENRISNFMLYQIAYAELYFPKVFWPSFNERYLKKALKVYQKRNRRFGKV
ncbi:MAG: polyprenyl diphosphate synthase [Clostridia bacterium]|nr:polyprenyl diphosphate synthase [Clostridia bacterium]